MAQSKSYQTSINRINLICKPTKEICDIKNIDNNILQINSFSNSTSIISLSEKPVENFKSENVTNGITEIDELFRNYAKLNSKILLEILKLFKNSSIKFCHETFGYNKKILKLCSFLMERNKVNINHENLNDYFWSFMNLRLDVNYFSMINNWISQLDGIEKEMCEIVKERNKQLLTCMGCQKNSVSILYLPCGHVVMCNKCYQISTKHCQACGSSIEEFHVIYI